MSVVARLLRRSRRGLGASPPALDIDPDVILYGSTLNVPYIDEELGDAAGEVSP
jgi:hypothetical protein